MFEDYVVGDLVSVFNRTTGTPTERIVQAKFNGREYTFKPGMTHSIPLLGMALMKEQTLVMGTRDNYNPMTFESYLAIDGTDPLTTIDFSDGDEDIDRSQIVGQGRNAKRGPKRPATMHDARLGRDIDAIAASR